MSRLAVWRDRPSQTTWLTLVLVGLALLFGLGIMIGRSNLGSPAVSVVSPGQRLMNSLGLGGGTYVCQVESEPSGAQIAVDGKPVAATTPVNVELSAGAHQVALSLPHEGGRTLTVTGMPHARVPLHASLFGTVQVSLASDRSPVPVSVAIDGDARGFAPIRIGAMTPGAHELEFSSPGQRDWTRAVDVHVDGLTEVIVHPVRESPTGVLQIRSWVGSPDEVAADAKARVWVDGVARGRTPLTLELPAGPHSVRAELDHESSAVQVIDLPGGNQRYANLTFGGGRAVTLIARTEPSDAGTRVIAQLPGVRAGELLSMWLHVYADGSWKRIPMTYATTRGSCQGGADLPASRPSEHPAYYVSATRNTGEEYFTEIHDAPPSQAGANLSAMP